MQIALADLVIYALVFLAIAFAFAARKLTQALFGALIHALQAIPVIGNKLASPFQAIETAITNACYSIEHGADELAGATWHRTASLLNWTWRELRSHAGALVAIATPVGALIALYHGIRALVHRLTHVAHGVSGGIKRLERKFHGIEHRVKTLEHEFSVGIGDDVLPRIRSLDRELTNLENRVIPGVRDLAGEAEADAQAALKRVEAIPFPTSVKTWAEAIAVGLGALGLDWLRCSSNPFNRNPKACNLWSELSQLLGVAFIAAELASLEELIKVAQIVTEDVVKGAETLLKV